MQLNAELNHRTALSCWGDLGRSCGGVVRKAHHSAQHRAEEEFQVNNLATRRGRTGEEVSRSVFDPGVEFICRV